MGSPTIRYGFLGGIVLIAEMLVIAALTQLGVLSFAVTTGQSLSDAQAQLLLVISLVTLALALAAPLLAGLAAARGTGFAKSGVWAGVLVMFVSGLAILVVLFVTPLDFSNVQGVPAYFSDSDILRIRALTVLIGGGFLMLARVIFGAIVGGIGGLIGRAFYREPRGGYDYGETPYESYLPLTFSHGPTRGAADSWQNRRYFGATRYDDIFVK